jgi:hypothetical protein
MRQIGTRMERLTLMNGKLWASFALLFLISLVLNVRDPDTASL